MGNSASRIAEKINDIDFEEEDQDDIDDLVKAIKKEKEYLNLITPDECDACPDCPDCSLKLGGTPDSTLHGLVLTIYSGATHCSVVVKMIKNAIESVVTNLNDQVDDADLPDLATIKDTFATYKINKDDDTIGSTMATALFDEEVITYNDTTGVLTFDSDTFDTLINCDSGDDSDGSEGYRLKYGAAVPDAQKRKRFEMGCDIAIIVLLLLIFWLVKTRKR